MSRCPQYFNSYLTFEWGCSEQLLPCGILVLCECACSFSSGRLKDLNMNMIVGKSEVFCEDFMEFYFVSLNVCIHLFDQTVQNPQNSLVLDVYDNQYFNTGSTYRFQKPMLGPLTFY